MIMDKGHLAVKAPTGGPVAAPARTARRLPGRRLPGNPYRYRRRGERRAQRPSRRIPARVSTAGLTPSSRHVP